jgi:hypothetical protein
MERHTQLARQIAHDRIAHDRHPVGKATSPLRTEITVAPTTAGETT